MTVFPVKCPRAEISIGHGFTLMEVVVCIGVLAVALGIMVPSVAFGSSRSAENARKARASEVIDAVALDVRNGVEAGWKETPLHSIPLPGETGEPPEEILYFDIDGVRIPTEEQAFFRYELQLRLDDGAARLLHVYSRVVWPARYEPGREQGAVDRFTSLSRP